MIKLLKPTSLYVCVVALLMSLNLKAQQKIKPEFNRSEIPTPIFEKNKGYIDLYWKAWELAWTKVKYQDGIPQSPYMDEGLWDNTIWIWDTEFMVLFCKYAPKTYPGIESLQNFYKVLLDKEKTSLRIQHPDNPPFYAWVESEYYNFSNDKDHLKQLIVKDKYLQRHYNWFETIKPDTKLHFKHARIAIEKTEKGYKWDGVQSGMDNTSRHYNTNGNMLWVDAIAQQALSALYIQRLANEIGEKKIAREYKKRYHVLKQIINDNYWDEEDGFYYDILATDGSFVKVKSPASFWVLLAEVASEKQAKRMAKYAVDPNHFGGKLPWPTLSRQEPFFNKELGDYWKGAIWLPTAYMATKSLEKYGMGDIVNELSENILEHMYQTYKQYSPHTIWECYNPSKPMPSFRVFGDKTERVRKDFCGWSALGPISMLIENVLGFYKVDAQKREVHWNLHHKQRNGIENLKFGDVVTSIVYSNGNITVESNRPYNLLVNKTKMKIKEGKQTIRYELKK